MIARLKGKVLQIETNWVLLDIAGVGYKVFVGEKVLQKAKINQELILFTHLHIRENLQELYGFTSFNELKIFEALLSVSGVGPKGALGILSHAEPEKIIEAISVENTAVFTSVPGIGRKIASKIILELKNKLTGEELQGTLPRGFEEATDALVQLGYSKFEITRVLSEIPKEIKDPEAQAQWALKKLGR